MPRELKAEASIEIAAPAARVWDALTDPAQVKQYYFGTDLEADWRVGGEMTFSGEWNGRSYEDRGTVIEVDAPRHLSYSHWSPLNGTPDTPENRHVLDFTLEERDGHTHLTLTQDNNANEEERAHSTTMWTQMLAELKALVEGSPAA